MTAMATKPKQNSSKGHSKVPLSSEEQDAIRRAQKAKQRAHKSRQPEPGNLFLDMMSDQVPPKLNRMQIILERDMTSSSPSFKLMLEEAATVYLITFEKTRSGFMGRHTAAKKAAMALVKGPEALLRHADVIIEGAFRRG